MLEIFVKMFIFNFVPIVAFEQEFLEYSTKSKTIVVLELNNRVRLKDWCVDLPQDVALQLQVTIFAPALVVPSTRCLSYLKPL